MKKTFVLLLSIIILGSLFAQVYSSNMLGQKLQPLGGIPSWGYALDEEGSATILYLDGVPVKRTEHLEIGKDTTVTETDLMSGRTGSGRGPAPSRR